LNMSKKVAYSKILWPHKKLRQIFRHSQV
jgi:hypothetical protein